MEPTVFSPREGVLVVPLSEDEQRILSEIEHHLTASDPHLVRQVATTTVYSDSRRGTLWGATGVVIGLILTLGLLSVSVVLSFLVGFGLMLVSGYVLLKNLRSLSRTGADQALRTLRAFSLREYFGFGDESGTPRS